MIEWLKQNKQGLIVGVIGSVIGTIALSSFSWILQSAPVFGNSFLASVLDSIYCNASIFSSLSIMEFLAFLLVSIGFLPVLLLLALLIKIVKRKIMGDKKDDNTRNSENKKGEDGTPKDDKKSIIKETLSVFIVLAILNAILISDLVIPALLLSKFNRDIILIRPYIEEKAVYQLQSDWLRMKCKSDYDTIYLTINQTIEENALK